MLVMVSNHASWRTSFLAGRYGNVGLLYPPERLFGPYPHLPYAMDNSCFAAWKNGEPWDEGTFVRALEWCEKQSLGPRWIVVPDVVGDSEATLRSWERWAPEIKERGFVRAMAVQDGMTTEVVQAIAPEVVFVGGTREWKLGTAAEWAREFPRVHVGRVNGLRDLMRYHPMGVESVDGTGFFRGRRAQLMELVSYLAAFPEPIDIKEQHLFMPIEDGHPRLPFPEEAATPTLFKESF